jgi:hypothetical protein
MMTVRLAAAFADLNDPPTRVAVFTESRRFCSVLESFDTKPAVLYLKTVRHDSGIRRG